MLEFAPEHVSSSDQVCANHEEPESLCPSALLHTGQKPVLDILKHIFSIEDRYVSVIEDYVRRGIETGEIEPHNPRLIAYVLYKIFEAFTYGSRLGEEGFDKEDVEELIPLLINKGLAPAKPATAAKKR